MAKYYMPAEWAPHDACLMQYPHRAYTFRLPQVYEQFLNIAKAIANEGEEPVVIFCPTEKDAAVVRQTLSDQPNISVRICPSDDSWARDMGPTFVLSKEVEPDVAEEKPKRIGIDWDFNSWGVKSPDYKLDQLAAERMCQALQEILSVPCPTAKVPVILEGGSIHVDGEGTLLTTKECLLNPNRNPTKTQAELEAILCDTLGCTKVIWLPNGVDGDDDTDGHVDNFACFLKPGHVVLSWTDDQENDPVNHQRCRIALEQLERETDAQGRSLTVHKLHLPPPMFFSKEDIKGLKHILWLFPPREVGQRMAGSYVNFYVANKAVVVPQFGHEEADRNAIETLQTLFPDRKVVGILSKEVLIGGGNIHCITQQVPKV